MEWCSNHLNEFVTLEDHHIVYEAALGTYAMTLWGDERYYHCFDIGAKRTEDIENLSFGFSEPLSCFFCVCQAGNRG